MTAFSIRFLDGLESYSNQTVVDLINRSRPSAADSKFASFSPPPLQELATGPVSQTGPQRQPGVGVGAGVCGPKDSLNRLAIGTSEASSPLSPHPPLDPLPGREGEILTSRTFDSPYSASRVSSSPLVQIEGTSLQALSVTPAPEPGSRFFPLAREAEIGCAADWRVIIPRHGQRSAGPRVEPKVTMRWQRAFAVKPSLARGWG